MNEGNFMLNQQIRNSEPSATAPRHIDVEFVYDSEEAQEVHVAGEFNNWNSRSLPMRKDEDDRWRASVALLPGRYEYRFIVDGDWQRLAA